MTVASLQCSTLDVSLDYSKVDGRTIGIAISRLASTNPDNRRGALLTNSGGPRGVGLAFPGALRDLGLPRSYQRNVAADRQRSPLFGAAAANITPCAFWPSEPIEPQVKITDEGPSDVLLIQNLRAPATQLAGAQKMRKAFGDRARIVTADQGGHLGYLLLDNPCADSIATNFLVTGERPADDVACGKGT